jgi:UPF0755 protein
MKKKVCNTKITILGVIVVVLAVIGFTAYNAAFKRYSGDEPCRIYIPHNSSKQAVSDTLRTRLGDSFGGAVYRLWSTWADDTTAACGSYVITPGDRSYTIANSLCHGRQTPVKVTFNNVRLLSELAERVSKNMEWGTDDFLATLDTVLPARGYEVKAEYIAAFVPDTYEFYWNENPGKVVNKLADERDKFWTDERRAQAKKMGLTPVQVATVASIAEEETGHADERGKVARLYLNRLDINMKLQADPTVKYAVGDFSLRRITGAHTSVQSPYNTYAVNGLPPGPIRLVERATLDAVLNAPQHDFLYMCASSKFNGYHDFARDYATHMTNARAYQAELNRRNIH